VPPSARPPAPSSSSFAPRGSNPKSSRSARVIASASVLTRANGCHAGPPQTPQRPPGATLIPALETDGVHRAPAFGRFVEHIHYIGCHQLVRDGEIEPDEIHGLRALDGRPEVAGPLRRPGSASPVERGKAGILHGGRRRVPDGMAVHGAKARAGVNRLCECPDTRWL